MAARIPPFPHLARVKDPALRDALRVIIHETMTLEKRLDQTVEPLKALERTLTRLDSLA